MYCRLLGYISRPTCCLNTGFQSTDFDNPETNSDVPVLSLEEIRRRKQTRQQDEQEFLPCKTLCIEIVISHYSILCTSCKEYLWSLDFLWHTHSQSLLHYLFTSTSEHVQGRMNYFYSKMWICKRSVSRCKSKNHFLEIFVCSKSTNFI